MQLHALLQQHETWGLAAAGWHAPYRYKKIRTMEQGRHRRSNHLVVSVDLSSSKQIYSGVTATTVDSCILDEHVTHGQPPCMWDQTYTTVPNRAPDNAMQAVSTCMHVHASMSTGIYLIHGFEYVQLFAC